LKNNTPRLKEWIIQVKDKQGGKISIDGHDINVEFIMVADWMSLQGVFGESWCYYCPCNGDNDGDGIPNNFILPIPRKNIFLCFFHADKRITETLRMLQFLDWLKILEIPYKSDPGTGIKEIKLDGIHVRRILHDNNWKEGVVFLDKSPEYYQCWEVGSCFVDLISKELGFFKGKRDR